MWEVVNIRLLLKAPCYFDKTKILHDYVMTCMYVLVSIRAHDFFANIMCSAEITRSCLPRPFMLTSLNCVDPNIDPEILYSWLWEPQKIPLILGSPLCTSQPLQNNVASPADTPLHAVGANILGRLISCGGLQKSKHGFEYILV